MAMIDRAPVLSRVIHRPGRRRTPLGTAPERSPHREVVRRAFAAYAERIRLGELVQQHGSPLFVLDVDRVMTRLLALRRELPDVRIHFAMTTLPHPAVIRAVDAFGASFAVASRGEVDLLEREGVAIGRCVHTNPVKTVADITGAYLRGIRTFVVDSPVEVAKLQELPDVAVLVRLAFPNRDATADSASTFGIAPDDAGALVGHCLRAGLRVTGFTFHVGSQTVSAAPWVHAIHRTLALMRRLERAHGIRFDTLDLGGGLPVAGDEPVPELAELARGIRAALGDAPSRYRILIEPGRFVAAPALTLVTRVVEGRPGEDAHPLVFAASELQLQPTAHAAARGVPLPLPPLAEDDLLVHPMMGACMAARALGFDGSSPTPVVVVPA